MSLAPSVAVPRPTFNWLPVLIALFCLLWSFAFVAGKIAVTYCPPLILLAARFSLAGILIWESRRCVASAGRCRFGTRWCLR